MITMVIGGSASGKSAYAEQLACGLPGRRIYLATMQPFGQSAEERIAKHRAMRQGKGFETAECTGVLEIQQMDVRDATILLEDLPNLVANELFSTEGGSVEGVYEGVVSAIRSLAAQAAHLVIVTGDLASDGCDYGEATRMYLQVLGRLQNTIAAEADELWEVVAGIPQLWKEKE